MLIVVNKTEDTSVKDELRNTVLLFIWEKDLKKMNLLNNSISRDAKYLEI